MKEKSMILITVKLVIAVLITFIAIELYITGADTESFIAYSFLFNAFVVADIISEIAKRKRRKRKMPQIIINNNGLNLEKIERMKEIKMIPTQKTKRTAIFTATKLAFTVLFLILNISVMLTKGENLLLLITSLLVTLACITLQIIEHIRETRSYKQ